MDFNGHMANTAYLNLAADVRMAFFAEHGFPPSEFRKLALGPVVRKEELEYFREVGIYDTAILIVLGDGVVANVVLQRTKGHNSGWIVITAGWAFGVTIAVYCVNSIRGAHLNPAVTIALASMGAFDWAKVPMYIAAQIGGGFLGGVIVWLAYLPHWKATQDPVSKLAVFSTTPAIRQPLADRKSVV